MSLPGKIKATHLRDQYLAAIERGDQLRADTVVPVLTPYEFFQAMQAGCFTSIGHPPIKGATWTGNLTTTAEKE